MKQKTFTKNIQLKTGNILELECTQEFIDQVQKHFNLDHPPTDDHIRIFVRDSFKTAFEKAIT
jgi:hypothetical protein